MDVRSRVRRKYLYQIIFCACIACLADALVLIGLNMFYSAPQTLSRGESSYEMQKLFQGDAAIWVFVLLIIGIGVFSLVFFLMQEPGIRYTGEIFDAMEEITHGDLNLTLDVKGDDELSQMAALINELGKKVQTVMDKERESERTKNELITNVAHDLRTPLTSVIGYLDLLIRTPGLPEEKKQEFMEITYHKAKYLEQLIEDLFGFTKLNYGKISMKVARLDLLQLLEQLLDEFYPNFAGHDMHYEIRSNAAAIPVNGDGGLLARLFENLIGNAIRYGEDGKLVQVEAIQQENMVTVTVKNYGYVIPEEKLPHLFDKFYRVEESRSSESGGTGLGLAIAKNIVLMHGGTISVKSDMDGTVFTVCLPTDFEIGKEQLDVPGETMQ
jgi:signal transduction histidine kinase